MYEKEDGIIDHAEVHVEGRELVAKIKFAPTEEGNMAYGFVKSGLMNAQILDALTKRLKQSAEFESMLDAILVDAKKDREEKIVLTAYHVELLKEAWEKTLER